MMGETQGIVFYQGRMTDDVGGGLRILEIKKSARKLRNRNEGQRD